MKKKLINRFTEFCLHNNFIKKDSEKAVIFGLEQIHFFLNNLFFIIIISICCNQIIEAMIYCIVHISISGVIGSYHAKTRLKCSIKTILVFLIYMFLVKIVPAIAYNTIIVIALLVYGILTWKLTPLEHKNRKWNGDQIIENRKKVFRFTIIYLIVCAFLYHPEKFRRFAFSLSIAMLIVSLMALIGYFFNEK